MIFGYATANISAAFFLIFNKFQDDISCALAMYSYI